MDLPIIGGAFGVAEMHAALRWRRVVARLKSKHALDLGGIRIIADKRVAENEIWFPDDLRLGGI